MKKWDDLKHKTTPEGLERASQELEQAMTEYRAAEDEAEKLPEPARSERLDQLQKDWGRPPVEKVADRILRDYGETLRKLGGE